SSDLQAELPTFFHRFAVDDREARRTVEGDATDEKCARRNFTLVCPTGRNFSGRFPANRPKWASRSDIDVEERFILERDGHRLFYHLSFNFCGRRLVRWVTLNGDRRRIFPCRQQNRRRQDRYADE